MLFKEKKHFEDSREHLQAELVFIELLIKRQLLLMSVQNAKNNKFDEFSGMYISEEEIRHYLDEIENSNDHEKVEQQEEVKALTQKISKYREAINHRIVFSFNKGVSLRLPKLAETFQLSEIEVEMLLCCLAPDIDIRFERYFAYLQNDVSKKRPTVQFLAKIFFREGKGVFEARKLFGSNARLLRNNLLNFAQEISGEESSFPALQPRVANSVIDYLVENDHLDPSLREIAEMLTPQIPEMETRYYNHHRQIVEEIIGEYEVSGRILPTYIWGPPGSRKSALIEFAAHLMGKKVLRVHCSKIQRFNGDLNKLFGMIERERRLHACILQFSHIDDLIDASERERAKLEVLTDFLKERIREGVITTGTKSYEEIKGILRTNLSHFHIPLPSIEERTEIWKSFLKCPSSEDEEDLINGLATKFRFTPGQIRSVMYSALMFSCTKIGEDKVVGLDDLYKCCREESNQGLLLYSQKIVPKYTWGDIVLPDDTLNQLKEICNCVKSRKTVYGSWGFEAKFSLGKGLNLLFSGPSGTGKTMSAEIIAGDLGIDLYKIDLSCVVSKYIGETEKNLSRIFKEAETSNCILFFDEADAIFGKRSEVKDSHDRYANIEISFLLQKMDEHEGIVILASNLRKNLDPAFTRRLNYVVEFPFPDEHYRSRIWRQILPAETPKADDIDFDFLSGNFKLAGGNIKNIALNSAFLAAKNGGKVSMENLILAVKREYQKMGKLCSKSEFSHYYSLVREAKES